jgi:hypothetical protein
MRIDQMPSGSYFFLVGGRTNGCGGRGAERGRSVAGAVCVGAGDVVAVGRGSADVDAAGGGSGGGLSEGAAAVTLGVGSGAGDGVSDGAAEGRGAAAVADSTALGAMAALEAECASEAEPSRRD